MAGDIKAKYLASVTLANTALDALAASSSRLAGYVTASVDVKGMSGGPPTDILLSGHFKAASASTNAGAIEVWVFGAENDTPGWPSGLSGAAGTFTAASRLWLVGAGRMAATIAVDSVANREYNVAPVSVAQLFGGVLPTHFQVFVSHNIQTGTAGWAGSGANAIYYTPVLAQYT